MNNTSSKAYSVFNEAFLEGTIWMGMWKMIQLNIRSPSFPRCHLHGTELVSASHTAGDASCSLVCIFRLCCKQERDMLERKANKQWRPETTFLSVGNGIQWWVSVSAFNHNNASFRAVTFGYRRVQMALKHLMLLCVPFLSCSSLWEVHSVLPSCRSVLSILSPLCLWSPLDLPCTVTCTCSRTTVLKPLTFPYFCLNSQYHKIHHPQLSSPPNSAFPPDTPDLTKHSSSGSQIRKFCLKTKGVGFRFLEILVTFMLLAFWVRLHYGEPIAPVSCGRLDLDYRCSSLLFQLEIKVQSSWMNKETIMCI